LEIDTAGVYEIPNNPLMVVRSGLHDPDWDKTVLVCLTCKYNGAQKQTNDNIEITCENTSDYEAMRNTNWCGFWTQKNNEDKVDFFKKLLTS
jgi:hypothetical protein